MRVTAPIIEAQIVETFLLNAVDFQTMIASKAARVRLAAAGRAIGQMKLVAAARRMELHVHVRLGPDAASTLRSTPLVVVVALVGE